MGFYDFPAKKGQNSGPLLSTGRTRRLCTAVDLTTACLVWPRFRIAALKLDWCALRQGRQGPVVFWHHLSAFWGKNSKRPRTNTPEFGKIPAMSLGNSQNFKRTRSIQPVSKASSSQLISENTTVRCYPHWHAIWALGFGFIALRTSDLSDSRPFKSASSGQKSGA